MASLDFLYAPIEDSPVPLQFGQMVSRNWTGYNDYTEFCVGEDGCVLFYFAKHENGKTTFFMYPSDEMSEMFQDINRNIDIWNFPSVKQQWPYFAKAYENGNNNSDGKVKLIQITDAYTGDKVVVFAITFNKYIEFDPTLDYRNAIHSLANYSLDTIQEVLKDNGCLNLGGQIKSFLRGMSLSYLLRKFISK